MRGLSTPTGFLLAGGCLLTALAVPAQAAPQAEPIKTWLCPFPTSEHFRFEAPRHSRCVANGGSLQLNHGGFTGWTSGNNHGVFNIAKPDGSGVAYPFGPHSGGTLQSTDRVISITIR